MQAIVTKYLNPTATKGGAGGRIKATCAAGSVTLPVDPALTEMGQHGAAAMALVRKLDWTPGNSPLYHGAWFAGCLPDGAGYAFVFTGDDTGFTHHFDPK